MHWLDFVMTPLEYQPTGAGKDAEPRPGVLRLVDEARDAGLKVAVCSAATKSSVIHVVKSLFGEARYEVSHYGLQCVAHASTVHLLVLSCEQGASMALLITCMTSCVQCTG